MPIGVLAGRSTAGSGEIDGGTGVSIGTSEMSRIAETDRLSLETLIMGADCLDQRTDVSKT